MKFIRETFFAIILVLGLIYLFFSFGNGSFDFSTWSATAQEALAICSFMVSLITFFIQIIRYM